MSHTLPVGRSAYLTALTQQIERKLQRALDSPAQRLDLLHELFTDVALEVDVRAQAILFDQNEDMLNPAEVGMKSSPCFYEVLAEHFIQMPENGKLVLRLIVQLWSQSFASQIFSLLFYNMEIFSLMGSFFRQKQPPAMLLLLELFELPPEKSEGLLRYASAFVQGATNVFWIDLQSNTRRFHTLFHYTFEEVAPVTIRLNKIPVQARRDLFFLLSRFLFFYEPADRLKTFLDHFPSFPNAFSISSPADIFVIELTDQLQKLKVEPVLLNYLKSMRVLQGMELRMTTSIRLRSCLYSFTSPGGPMYPTRAVRHATFEILDLLFPKEHPRVPCNFPRKTSHNALLKSKD